MPAFHRPSRLCVLLSLLLLIALSFSACGDSAESLLAYQAEPLRLVLSYEEGGVSVRAELKLGARPKDGGVRDATLTYLSPETVSGLTYTRVGTDVTVRLGDNVFPTTDEPFSIATLFEIPGSARVMGIEREEGGARCATLTHGDCVYTLRFRPGQDRPYAISRRRGELDELAVTVEEELSPRT